jgi:hypothetical protein
MRGIGMDADLTKNRFTLLNAKARYDKPRP